MAISVADNFSYQGGKPLDARMKFSTVNEMVGTAASVLYDGCFAYVAATKKYYSYDSTNEDDPALGKWREYSPGGSVDVDDNPTQGSANPVSSGGVYDALTNKVDKVLGKGLSTNDYDNTEKSKVTSAKNHADIDNGSNPHNTTFDNLAVRPEKAALSDLTITDPGYKAYGEVIDLTGKEYVVGDYILADGKRQPIYRKYCETTTPNGYNVSKAISYSTLGISNSANIINIPYMIATDSDGYNTIYEQPWWARWWHNGNKQLSINVTENNQGFFNRPVWMIIEYTKSTDTPS